MMADIPVTESPPTCRVVRPGQRVHAKQQVQHAAGISADTVGAKGIHMQIATIPPLARAKAHKHEGHETAMYVLSGKCGVWFGEELEQHLFAGAGEFFYTPANMPHLPYNPSEEEACVAVIARTDPHEEESVVMLGDLDRLFPYPVGAYKLPRTNTETSGER
jgi:uncharacterized RmlC-like cupin family protein